MCVCVCVRVVGVAELGVEKAIEEVKESKEGDDGAADGGAAAEGGGDAEPPKEVKYTNHAAALLAVLGTYVPRTVTHA